MFPAHFPTNPMTSISIDAEVTPNFYRPGTTSLSFAEGAAACCGNAVGDSEPVSKNGTYRTYLKHPQNLIVYG